MDSIVQDCLHGDLKVHILNLKDKITKIRNEIADIGNVGRSVL